MTIFSNKKPNTFYYYTTKEYSEGTDDAGFYIRNQDDDYVYAKKALDYLPKDIRSMKKSFAYYVRSGGGKICDPRCIHSLPENKISHVDKVCKNTGKFIKVNQSAFLQYLEFLKLESDQHYKSACRACDTI